MNYNELQLGQIVRCNNPYYHYRIVGLNYGWVRLMHIESGIYDVYKVRASAVLEVIQNERNN